MKNLPIGISDFKYLIDQNYYYVDKSLFIKEIIETSGQVLLIARPRRFGKTLNLSMLKYFFEKNNGDTNYLFKNTNIEHYEKFKEYHNQYPVIFLTFKDIKADNWQDAYQQFVSVISKEFARRSAVINQEIGSYQLAGFLEILEKRGSKASYENSLLLLTEILSRCYKKTL